MTMKKALTLAGSETSGGAGMQADLKTFQEHDVYGTVALTSIVTMDTKNWNHHVTPIDTDLVEKQLDTILFSGVDAMKTGMMGSVDIIEMAAKKIDEHGLDKFILDPVMACKGDGENTQLLQPENADAMRELLLPRALITTPNLLEAGQLAQTGTIKTMDELKEAAVRIHEKGVKNVVIKGGKTFDSEKAIDLFYDGSEFTILEQDKIDTTYNHGAGCTFAAAITANLAHGKSVKEATTAAKHFVTAAIAHGWKLNQFVGPVMHGAYNKYQD